MLKIAKNLSLPIEAVTETFALLGKRGTGKTTLATVMAEEMLKTGQPVVIYDPTSAWFGLKSSKDGKHPGFPVVIFGGDHADVPLEESSGATISSVIVEKRIPAILDVGLLRKGERVRFMTSFCETLYHKNREALHFFVDEAHTLAPQNIRHMPEAARLLGAMEDIVLQGRRRGLGITVISQRPALVNKNITTQCEVMVAMQLTGAHDRKAVEEWVDVHGDDVSKGKEMIESLSSLQRGEGWLWSPGWLRRIARVNFRDRETFDSSATPKAGGRVITPKMVAEIDLDALGAEIKATVEKAKADDPKTLRLRIAELEKKLNAVKPAAVAPQYPDLREKVKELQDYIARAPKIDPTFNGIKAVVDYFSQRPSFERVGRVATKSVRGVLARTSDVGRNTMKTTPIYDTVIGHGKCSVEKPMPRNMLTALAQHRDGLTKRQILIHTGYRASGPVSKTFAEIIRNGWVIDSRGVLMITESGLSALGKYTPLPVGDELREQLLNGSHGGLSQMERNLLQVVCEAGGSIAKNDILLKAGYAASGPVSKAFARLVGLGYVNAEGRGHLRAAEQLFS